MEIKNCQNCKKDFTIEVEDFNFYEKIKVSPPRWCPECRQLRRSAWRNERVLYRRNCDLCEKSTVTIYSPNKPHKVYCNECWWGDGWDGASYGRDFDFSRPFFEQYRELQLEVPRMALLNKRSINSEYTNHALDNKNVFLAFSVTDSENVFYGTWVLKSRDCMDCFYVREAGERLYECIDMERSYQCQFCYLLKDCVGCYYCYDMHGCTECFLSFNLRNKSYCFQNVQYTKEEYYKKVADFNLGSFEVRDSLYKKFLEMKKGFAFHRYIVSERNINSTGNLLFNSKNAKVCFDADHLENTKYVTSVSEVKDSYDLLHVGFQSELDYEIQGCTRISNCQFCHLCYDNMNIMYSDTCQNSQNLFGCISIKKGEYMILNKKYSKEEYEKLKDKIIEHMKGTGEYGEFFPLEVAPVCYNETIANLYMPLTREEVLAKGWQWEDEVTGTFNKETIKLEDLPDKIEDVQDDILNQILKCENCSKNYNIVPFELSFYRRENIPIPHLCPDCRYKRRFDIRSPRNLWHSKCKCDKEGHGHNGVCPNEFETSYAPERVERVYCESCYNKEVY
ncbi:MAG: hypothetical protein WC783_04875 [Candidatus Paceibacterota bacterium]|jgi:hypothetical protein